jgi:hypothetical protein
MGEGDGGNAWGGAVGAWGGGGEEGVEGDVVTLKCC